MTEQRIKDIDWEISAAKADAKSKIDELEAEKRKLKRDKSNHTAWFEIMLKAVTVAGAILVCTVVALVALKIVDDNMTDISDIHPWLLALAAVGGAFIGLHYVTKPDRSS